MQVISARVVMRNSNRKVKCMITHFGGAVCVKFKIQLHWGSELALHHRDKVIAIGLMVVEI